MTLRHMIVFRAICDEGNMTRAAEALHMTQPAMSLAVKELETAYGVRLFDRVGRRIHRTPAGETLYERSAEILALFDAIPAALTGAERQSVLRLGSSITLGIVYMPAVAKAFERAYPDACLRVSIENSAALEAAVLSGELDAAFVEGRPESGALRVEPLTDDVLVAIVPPDHPLADGRPCTLEQWAQEPFLLREKGSAVRALLDGALLIAGHEVTPKWESVSTQALLQAVAAGLGVSVLPRSLAMGSIRSGKVYVAQVNGLSLTRRFSFIMHKNKPLTAPFQALLEFCRSDAAQGRGD